MAASCLPLDIKFDGHVCLFIQQTHKHTNTFGILNMSKNLEDIHSTSCTGTLYAISDIHVGHPANRGAWAALTPHPGDGLIICGDIGEKIEHLQLAFSRATECFDTVWWCPGNHELYTMPTGPSVDIRGENKYQQCVDLARSFGVLTPEDDFILWKGKGGPAVIAPIFTLYDYSFRPADVSLESMSNQPLPESILFLIRRFQTTYLSPFVVLKKCQKFETFCIKSETHC